VPASKGPGLATNGQDHACTAPRGALSGGGPGVIGRARGEVARHVASGEDEVDGKKKLPGGPFSGIFLNMSFYSLFYKICSIRAIFSP
jgi:hypothetical protein